MVSLAQHFIFTLKKINSIYKHFGHHTPKISISMYILLKKMGGGLKLIVLLTD